MDIYDRLNQLLLLKKNVICSDEDMQKCKSIEQVMKNKGMFFNIPMDISIGILDFLGIPEAEILDAYFELVSLKNYHNNIQSQNLIFPENFPKQK